MKINGNAIRPGNIIEHDGRLWRAVRVQHTQPGKGGAYLQVLDLAEVADQGASGALRGADHDIDKR